MGGCRGGERILDYPGGPSVAAGPLNVEAGGREADEPKTETEDVTLLAFVIKEGTTGAKGCRHL